MGVYLQIASIALSVIGQSRQASAVKRRNKQRNIQLAQEKRLNAISAKDKENVRLRRLEEVLGTNIVRGYASGYSPNSSGSWLALANDEKRKANKDIRYTRLYGNARGSNIQDSIFANNAETSAAASSAFFNSASAIFKGAQGISESAGGGSSGGSSNESFGVLQSDQNK